MNETTITVAGNLVNDVDLRRTAKGDAVARFRLASTSSRFDRDRGHWVEGETTYWNVTAWRRAAENASASLAKGHPVVVFGRVRQRTVDRPAGEGSRTMQVTYTDLEALHFGQDLTRCRSVYQRAPIGPQSSELRTGTTGDGSGGNQSVGQASPDDSAVDRSRVA